MTVTTGPFGVTGGATTAIPVPPRGIYAAVVFQNVSPLNLLVSGGSSVEEWLAQFQANVFLVDDTNAPYTLTAPGQVATLTGQVLATWYDPGEVQAGIPGTFPAPLYGAAITAAITQSTSPAISHPFSTTTIPGAPSDTFGPFPVPFACQTVAVYLGGLVGDACAVQVSNLTTGEFSQLQTMFFKSSGAQMPLFFPVPCNAGDSVEITCNAVNSINVPLTSVDVFALGQYMQPTPLRPDGRLFPVLPEAVTGSLGGAGNAILVAAPAAPVRLLLGAVDVTCSAAAVQAYLSSMCNGVAINFANVWGATGGAKAKQWPPGLLLDPGQGLVMNQVGVGFSAFEVEFDRVQ